MGAGISAETKDDLYKKLAMAESRIDNLESKVRFLYKIHDPAEDTPDEAYAHVREIRERNVLLKAMNNRVQALELGQARLGGQLDFLLRLQNLPVALPPAQPSAPGPPNLPGPVHDTA